MAPTKKAKAAGVSASSFLDLKAELAKQETEFSKKKAVGGQSYIVGGIQRPDKVSELNLSDPTKQCLIFSLLLESDCSATSEQRRSGAKLA